MSRLRRPNGIELDFEDSGDGPAVFLTHGYSATGEMWRPQRTSLDDRYRIVTWDMRGHGRSTSPDDPSLYSHALCVGDMAAILDDLEIERAVIGGLSLGGFLSLDFYRQHPERVTALVICDTGPGYKSPEARAQWNQSAQRRASDFEERGLAALTRSREVQEAASRHRSAQGLAHAARGMLAQFDDAVILSLPAIAVPSLVVVGDRDQPFLAPSTYMVAKIPGARLAMIPDAGHASNLDQPEIFNAHLGGFLDQVTGSPRAAG